MTIAIEAKSLSTVLSIADDPPKNPRDGAGLVQEQLVLYIARIPGSRDIFLTTMKPLQKVVTAPDVESCLYYVHLDSIEDKKLLDEPPQDIEVPQSEDSSGETVQSQRAGTIKRKPIPASPQLVLADSLGRPIDHDNQPQPPRPRLGGAAQPNQRMELRGPRPMQPRLHTLGEMHTAGNSYVEQGLSPRRWSEQPKSKAPELPPRPDVSNMSTGVGNHEARVNGSYHPHERERSDRVSPSQDHLQRPSTNNDFSLTLIRRYNGLQSNVGKIVHQAEPKGNGYDQQGRRSSSLLRSPNGVTIIDILSPGYMKFDKPVIRQEDSATGEAHPQQHSTWDINPSESFDGPVNSFRRHLQTLSAHKRPQEPRLESSSSYLSKVRRRSRVEMEDYNRASSAGSDFDTFSPGNPPSPIGSEARGFVFESPWHSFCEFSTGIAGRSLKCKHNLGSTSEAVSELRFNLPSSKAFAPSQKPPLSADTTRESKRTSIFSRHGRAQSVSEYADNQTPGGKVELEDRMDLSLGQERAGGGFGGKQAKLGKLIIENEGLKMLDLLVAANVALWWKVYERAA
ncbi:MAG: hypothetical protein Q9195_000371 [Heterodermia aff. obscurata]